MAMDNNKYLKKPNTEKISWDGENDRLECGVSTMQGWRKYQENTHVCIFDFDDGMSLFGVFDGHGGAEVAQYAAEALPPLIRSNQMFIMGDYQTALIEAFKKFDASLLKEPALHRLRTLRLINATKAVAKAHALGRIGEMYEMYAEDQTLVPGIVNGCSAVICLYVNDSFYVASAGDSRCVISAKGKAIDMSHEPDPEHAQDDANFPLIKGIRFLSFGNVQLLKTSRILGDHYRKHITINGLTQHLVTAEPHYQTIEIKPRDCEFIVLACDGVWNSLDCQAVVDFIANRIETHDINLSSISEELFELCISPDTTNIESGCDNMTCMIVKLKNRFNHSVVYTMRNKP